MYSLDASFLRVFVFCFLHALVSSCLGCFVSLFLRVLAASFLRFFVSWLLRFFVSSCLGCFVSSFLRVLAASFLRFFVSRLLCFFVSSFLRVSFLCIFVFPVFSHTKVIIFFDADNNFFLMLIIFFFDAHNIFFLIHIPPIRWHLLIIFPHIVWEGSFQVWCRMEKQQRIRVGKSSLPSPSSYRLMELQRSGHFLHFHGQSWGWWVQSLKDWFVIIPTWYPTTVFLFGWIW